MTHSCNYNLNHQNKYLHYFIAYDSYMSFVYKKSLNLKHK